jgi:hypothetical protein
MTITMNSSHGTQRTASVAAPPSSPEGPNTDTEAAVLLPEPSACALSDGSLAGLSMLLTQIDEHDRTESRQIETTADQAATQEENERVAQLEKKADDDRDQGLASGIGGMVGGAFAIAGGLVPSPAGASGAAQSSAAHDVLSGIGAISSKTGDLVGALYRGNADSADASAARFDAEAQSDLRRYNEAQGDVQTANQAMQKVEQFLDQIQQTENATRLTAATFRG